MSDVLIAQGFELRRSLREHVRLYERVSLRSSSYSSSLMLMLVLFSRSRCEGFGDVVGTASCEVTDEEFGVECYIE